MRQNSLVPLYLFWEIQKRDELQPALNSMLNRYILPSRGAGKVQWSCWAQNRSISDLDLGWNSQSICFQCHVCWEQRSSNTEEALELCPLVFFILNCESIGLHSTCVLYKREKNPLWGLIFKMKSSFPFSCFCCSCWTFPFSQILHQYCGSGLQRPHLPWPESGLSFWKSLTQLDCGCTVHKEWAGIVRTV